MATEQAIVGRGAVEGAKLRYLCTIDIQLILNVSGVARYGHDRRYPAAHNPGQTVLSPQASCGSLVQPP